MKHSGILRLLLSGYIYSFIHVALASLSLTILSYTIADLKIDWTYGLFIFISTYTLYHIHRLAISKRTKREDKKKKEEAKGWIHYTNIVSTLIGASVSLYLFYLLDNTIKLYLIIPIVLSLLYTLPLFKGYKLRDFPIIKIFVIAICWGLLTTFIPMHSLTMPVAHKVLITSIVSIFVFALTIPFDIRDFERDKKDGTITLPIKYGIIPSINFSNIGISTGIFLSLITYNIGAINVIYCAVMIVSFVIIKPFIARTRPNSPEFYVNGLIEGLLMLPVVLYFLLDRLSPLF